MSFLPARRRKTPAPDQALKACVLTVLHLPDGSGLAGIKAAAFTRDGLTAITVFRLAMVSLSRPIAVPSERPQYMTRKPGRPLLCSLRALERHASMMGVQGILNSQLRIQDALCRSGFKADAVTITRNNASSANL